MNQKRISDYDDEANESMGTESESSKESDDVNSVDTVTFKCIGASKELHSQDCCEMEVGVGKSCDCEDLTEPINLYDSNAIAFRVMKRSSPSCHDYDFYQNFSDFPTTLTHPLSQ